jgi:hypothetical protein
MPGYPRMLSAGFPLFRFAPDFLLYPWSGYDEIGTKPPVPHSYTLGAGYANKGTPFPHAIRMFEFHLQNSGFCL